MLSKLLVHKSLLQSHLLIKLIKLIKNSDMFRILWDPSSGSIKRASLKLLVMFCVRSRCLARSAYGEEERGVHGFGGET